MTMAVFQPRIDQPVVNIRGLATQPWLDYWQRLATAGAGQYDDAIRELSQRIDSLAGAGSFRILGQQSVSVQGVVQPDGVVIITLAGDEDEPQPRYYYGTGADGAKGFHSLAFKLNREGENEITVFDKTEPDDAAISLYGGETAAELGDDDVPAAIVFHGGEKTQLQAEPATGEPRIIKLPDASGMLVLEAPADGREYVRKNGAWVSAAPRVVLPVVTGEIENGQPVLVYADDGNLIYTEIK